MIIAQVVDTYAMSDDYWYILWDLEVGGRHTFCLAQPVPLHVGMLARLSIETDETRVQIIDEHDLPVGVKPVLELVSASAGRRPEPNSLPAETGQPVATGRERRTKVSSDDSNCKQVIRVEAGTGAHGPVEICF